MGIKIGHANNVLDGTRDHEGPVIHGHMKKVLLVTIMCMFSRNMSIIWGEWIPWSKNKDSTLSQRMILRGVSCKAQGSITYSVLGSCIWKEA